MLSATRNFALGGFMTRPVNYDSTMLLRLSAEMKQAFYAACKARGVVPSEHARQLITDYVLNHWGVDKPKSSDTIALGVAIPPWICSQVMTSHPQKQNHQCAHQCAQIAPKRKKGVKDIR